MIKIMKQTAVEWLADKLNNDFGNNDFLISYANEISKAKEFEKQQIIKALKAGVNIELGINEFKDLHLTYNQAFEKYIKDNYED